MKVILTQEHKDLGGAGEIVSVKPGYARNFLIPKSMALEVNKTNLKIYEEQKKRAKAQEGKELLHARKIAEEMSKLSLTANVTVGEDEKVFGSITAQDIANLLADKGFRVDKRDILLDESIKALGIYNVEVKIHSEVKAEVKLWVIKK